MKLESERADFQDITLPISIVYNDSDTLAHPSVSSHKAKHSLIFFSSLLQYHTKLSYSSITQIFLHPLNQSATPSPLPQLELISLLVILSFGYRLVFMVLIDWTNLVNFFI